jgi:hypothetical protein
MNVSFLSLSISLCFATGKIENTFSLNNKLLYYFLPLIFKIIKNFKFFFGNVARYRKKETL